MHRAVSALAIGTAAIVAAVLLFGWLAAPAARPTASAPAAASTVVAGAFHVHTHRSDGTGSPDHVAASARDAGLQFVIFADHGDGPGRSSHQRIAPGCCASTASKLAPLTATTSPSVRARPRTRSLVTGAMSSKTSSGSADSASSRIQLQPSASCSGGGGPRRSMRWNGSTGTRNGVMRASRACSGRS